MAALEAARQVAAPQEAVIQVMALREVAPRAAATPEQAHVVEATSAAESREEAAWV